jgi:tRNA(Arg) A34 adenosine deaminase TadA
MSRTKYYIKATIYNKKNQIVSEAENSFTKTHPTQLKYAKACGMPFKAFLHAEMLAIIRAKGKGYKIVVERYNKAGEPVLAKPCPICMMAIQEAKIARIEYTL